MSKTYTPSAKEMANLQENLDVLFQSHKDDPVSKKEAWAFLKKHALSTITGFDPETKECTRVEYHPARFLLAMWRQAALVSGKPFSAQALYNMAVILDEDYNPSDAPSAPKAIKKVAKKTTKKVAKKRPSRSSKLDKLAVGGSK